MGKRIHNRRTHDDNFDRKHNDDNTARNDNDQPDDKRNDYNYNDDEHNDDDDQQFLDDLYNLASRRNDNDNSDTCYVLDDRTYNYVVDLYAAAINDNSTANDNNTSTVACHCCPTATSGGNYMAANYGIHSTDDDAFYHCSRNDCPCNDTNTVHVDLDRILDRTCGHECCDASTCDCASCDRACESCS